MADELPLLLERLRVHQQLPLRLGHGLHLEHLEVLGLDNLKNDGIARDARRRRARRPRDASRTVESDGSGGISEPSAMMPPFLTLTTPSMARDGSAGSITQQLRAPGGRV